MVTIDYENIVEGLLFAAEDPLTIDRIHKIFCVNNSDITIDEIENIINILVKKYGERGIELKKVASGWRFQTKPELSKWINKLWEERPARYSKALLEVLVLIAYRQPVTRPEIEDIRGVAINSNIIKTLLEHEWVKIIGHREIPGKPALFATTKKFLDHFNLKNLEELSLLLQFNQSNLSNSEFNGNIIDGS